MLSKPMSVFGVPSGLQVRCAGGVVKLVDLAVPQQVHCRLRAVIPSFGTSSQDKARFRVRSIGPVVSAISPLTRENVERLAREHEVIGIDSFEVERKRVVAKRRLERDVGFDPIRALVPPEQLVVRARSPLHELSKPAISQRTQQLEESQHIGLAGTVRPKQHHRIGDVVQPHVRQRAEALDPQGLDAVHHRLWAIVHSGTTSLAFAKRLLATTGRHRTRRGWAGAWLGLHRNPTTRHSATEHRQTACLSGCDLAVCHRPAAVPRCSEVAPRRQGFSTHARAACRTQQLRDLRRRCVQGHPACPSSVWCPVATLEVPS